MSFLCGISVIDLNISPRGYVLKIAIPLYWCAWDAKRTDSPVLIPWLHKHAISKTHVHRTRQRTSMHAFIRHTLSLCCRMCLATPPWASACSVQQAMANPICCSVMPPSTCREFWVATPLGWAPLTPPCCKPSSVRVRVIMRAFRLVCKSVFMWIY